MPQAGWLIKRSVTIRPQQLLAHNGVVKTSRAELLDCEARAAALSARLEQHAFLQPLERSAKAVAQYGLFELADAVFVRCATDVDPEALQDPELHAAWTQRVLDGEILHEPFAHGRRPYWVVHEGRRIGTIAFAVEENATARSIEISSVYVRPSHRRQGWGARILQAVKEAAFEAGFERAALHVEWNNQAALRFYCAQGMWVAHWTQAIELYFAKAEPPWQAEVKDDHARFKVKGRIVAVAHHQGATLGWNVIKTVNKQLKASLERTAALQLAVMGWPIIRSGRLWQEQVRMGFSDTGSFEGFAWRVRQLENQLRCKGWNLPAARNPSFAALPTPAEIEVQSAQLQILLSDAQRLVIPFESLGIPHDGSDTLQSVHIADDNVICTLQSGQPLTFHVDYLLFLTQSPEHLSKAAELIRKARGVGA